MNKAIKNCSIFHFADDTNLLSWHKNEKTLQKILNKDLKTLVDWLCSNRLSLNVGKTEFIVFRPPRKSLSNRIVLTLNRTKIFESTKIKYLGIILDQRLTWRDHINELSKKLGRAIGMLYKARHFCTLPVLKTLYYSIFNSHITYGLPVWGYANNIYLNKIEKLQKKAIRAITFSTYREHVTPLCRKLEILNIKDLVFLKTASLIWDLEKSNLPYSLSKYFIKANVIHAQETRFASSGNYRVGINSNLYQSIAAKVLMS